MNEIRLFRFHMFPMFIVKNDEEENDLRAMSNNKIKRIMNFQVIKEKDNVGRLDNWYAQIDDNAHNFFNKCKLRLIHGLLLLKHMWRLAIQRKITEDEVIKFYRWTIEDIEEYRENIIKKLAHI